MINYVSNSILTYFNPDALRLFSNMDYQALVDQTILWLNAEEFVGVLLHHKDLSAVRDLAVKFLGDVFKLSAADAEKLAFEMEYTRQLVLTSPPKAETHNATIQLFWPLMKKFKVFGGNIQYKLHWTK